MDRFNLRKVYPTPIFHLKSKEIIFDVTIPEFARFYSLEYLGFHNSFFNAPPHLKWLEYYLKKFRTGLHGSKLSWQKLTSPERARAKRYDRHLVANIKDEQGTPCYSPLGLQIPRPNIRKL